MAAGSAKELIERSVTGLQEEVPSLAPLKLVVGVELRGRGDVQLYRVELPGPDVRKDPAADARVRVSVSRAEFNELAANGSVRRWREAIEAGHVIVTGPEQILKLVANVAARQEERNRTRKVGR